MNYSLKPWHTFGITQYAQNIICVSNSQQLLDVWQRATQHNQPVLILGDGSNVLFLEDFSGTVIINRIMGTIVNESNYAWHIHIGAGENWHELVKFTIAHNMPGLENLAFIPGCVGASPIQNIGAYGVEFKQVCEYVDYIELTTGKLHRLNVDNCCFGYRDSIFKYNEYQNQIAIVAVGLRLDKVWHPILTYGDLTKFNPITVTPYQVFQSICHMRATKLPNPKIYGNAGSFFKNPIVSSKYYNTLLTQWPDMPYYPQINGSIKLSAAWLIDKCQLKGITRYGAEVYRRHALVLINKNHATSKDIIYLAHIIYQSVGEKFNVLLEPEVCFIGHFGKVNALEMIV